MDTLKNWSGNYTFGAAQRHAPESLEELQALVAKCDRVKAFGSRHSFNDIADTLDDHIAMEHFDGVVEIDRERQTVTVEAGTRYGSFCAHLHREGFALRNLASLPHITVAGAIATATHGSGDANQNLSAAVSGMEMVTANGELVHLSRERDSETFRGAVVGLGALGIVTEVTLDLVPTFLVRQDVYEHLPVASYEAHFEEIEASAYSVSLFTDWRSPTHINHIWRKQIVEANDDAPAPTEWMGATLATHDVHPIATESAINCTPQQGIPGPWYDRLPHFRMDYTPSSGEELQTEYFVPRAHALAAFRSLLELREQIAPLIQISEIRTIATDDLWLSPAYEQDCVAFHFTWKLDWPRVGALLPSIEARLAPFGARPHWGKLFTMDRWQLQSLYTRLPDFQKLAQRFDPTGKFRNAFLEKWVL